MSMKVCVDRADPRWKDTVTLRQLRLMISALIELGASLDSPVTYLFDDGHVWLETVHDVP